MHGMKLVVFISFGDALHQLLCHVQGVMIELMAFFIRHFLSRGVKAVKTSQNETKRIANLAIYLGKDFDDFIRATFLLVDTVLM
jgi:hypothetical protein